MNKLDLILDKEVCYPICLFRVILSVLRYKDEIRLIKIR
jgi:hypothetical protein